VDKERIRRCLERLNEELGRAGVKGELCLYGGAAMSLVYDARPSTKDVDAVFRPAREMREAARRVAEAEDLPEDWLNDAVKGFVTDHARREALDLPHLKVYAPEPDYLLAMKVLAARVEGTDKGDVEFLIARLGLKAPDDVFAILQKYYPHERIKPASRFFIEELFGK
jgi:hypothetical protein